MQSEVEVKFTEAQRFRMSPGEAADVSDEAARTWLDQQYSELGCVPTNPVGKVLSVGKVLGVARAAVHQLHARGPLGHEARHLQREEGATHAPHQAEDRQRSDVETPGTGVPADAEQAQDDRQRDDDREVRRQEQEDPLTHGSRIACQLPGAGGCP